MSIRTLEPERSVARFLPAVLPCPKLIDPYRSHGRTFPTMSDLLDDERSLDLTPRTTAERYHVNSIIKSFPLRNSVEVVIDAPRERPDRDRHVNRVLGRLFATKGECFLEGFRAGLRLAKRYEVNAFALGVVRFHLIDLSKWLAENVLGPQYPALRENAPFDDFLRFERKCAEVLGLGVQ